jgi:ribonuclease BN (tRNA processing enzyme)
MKLKFWGTRGSISTPGRETVRYGGNTPCVEVRLDSGELIIFDAGTGIRNLGEYLIETGESVNTYILISHPHWDHTQGFPFFKPAFISGNEITIVGGETDKVSLKKMISDQMNKIYFPIQLNELKATLKFRRVQEETFKVFDAVQTIFVNHPSFAVGYRLTHKGKQRHISDNEPSTGGVCIDPQCGKTDHGKVHRSREIRTSGYLRVQGPTSSSTMQPIRQEYVDRVGWGHSIISSPSPAAEEMSRN